MAFPTFQPDSLLDLLRVSVSIVILGYACLTDWRQRRAPNQLWYIMGAAGLVFDLYAFWRSGFDTYFAVWLAAGVAFIYLLVYLIFRLGGFGGADAKALIALAIMFPVHPMIALAGAAFPAAGDIMSPVFALSVLGNAVVLTIVVPIGVLAYNLLTVPIGEVAANPLGAVTGYKASIGSLRGKHLRLMHRYEEADGKVERRMAFRGSELDDGALARLARWRDEGKIGDRVWVTPKLPFLIPITLGFLAGVFYGDILMQVIAILLGRY